MSKSLSPAKHNYAIYDRSCYRSYMGSKSGDICILEATKHTIEILNDHRNLMYF